MSRLARAVAALLLLASGPTLAAEPEPATRLVYGGRLVDAEVPLQYTRAEAPRLTLRESQTLGGDAYALWSCAF